MTNPALIGFGRTWDQARNDPVGALYHARVGDGMALFVTKGRLGLLAYVGFPPDSPLANYEYTEDDWPGSDVSVHGGFTFSGQFDHEGWYGRQALGPELDGWWWYGWDFNHFGDAMMHSDELLAQMDEYSATSGLTNIWRENLRGRRWTPDEVLVEAEQAARELSQIARSLTVKE